MANKTKNKPTCFMSYNAHDKIFVRKLSRHLESQGISVWMDELIIKGGDSITDLIQEGLETYDIFIIVLSPYSVKSLWVKEELRLALQKRLKKGKKRIIIPIMLERCKIPGFLQDYKYISFIDKKKYHLSFKELFYSIVCRDIFLEKYRKSFAGATIFESVKVSVSISGTKQEAADFRESCKVTLLYPIKKYGKDILVDGKIEQVDSSKPLKRKKVNKTTERWELNFASELATLQPIDYWISYKLKNEFKFAKKWYYKIEAPTRFIEFKFIFSDKCIPNKFWINTMQTYFVLDSKTIKGKHVKGAKQYTYKKWFPVYKDWFEINWE